MHVLAHNAIIWKANSFEQTLHLSVFTMAIAMAKEIELRYKNLLTNFHPLLKAQIIPSAKNFLKRSHDSASALKSHIKGLQALKKILSDEDVAKEFALVLEQLEAFHGAQVEFLQGFYANFLVPLETNLRRDGAVVKAHKREYLKNKKDKDSLPRCLDDVKGLEQRRVAWIGGTLGGVFKDNPIKIIPIATPTPPQRYVAVYAHSPDAEGQGQSQRQGQGQLLAFEPGDILESCSHSNGWLFGVNRKSLAEGWFPGGFVVEEEPEVDYEGEEEDGG